MSRHKTPTTEHKKPGPVPGPPTKKFTVLLEEELAEWGKRQPGGLSELMRRLLKEERSRTRPTSVQTRRTAG